MRLSRRILLAPVGLLLLLAAGCSGSKPQVALASAELLPEVVLQQEERVQEAYRFAIANPAALETVPCYCGCGGLGHTNNLQCYLQPESSPDHLLFDIHGAGCGVCVDITQDVMELVKYNTTPVGIRAYIDSKYSAIGPEMDTPHPMK
jgi:hypothetical protein